jgi:hypothetical protein
MKKPKTTRKKGSVEVPVGEAQKASGNNKVEQ